MNRRTAREIAKRFIDAQSPSETKLVILDDLTRELDVGWVFFYDSQTFLETRDLKDAIAGNAPIIVDRQDGSVHVTGTALPIESYIESYRNSHPRKPAVVA